MLGPNATRKMLGMGKLVLVCALTALALAAVNAVAGDADECVQGSIGPDGQPVRCPDTSPIKPQACTPGNPLPDGTYTRCPGPYAPPQDCVQGSIAASGEPVHCPPSGPANPSPTGPLPAVGVATPNTARVMPYPRTARAWRRALRRATRLARREARARGNGLSRTAWR